MEARIAELKSSNSAEPLDWNLVESSFKFTFLWPGELALINQNTGEVAAEKAELNVGGLNFQANFYSSPTIQRDNLSNAQQSQLQNLGYQMELQADGTVNGIAYEELTFVKEDPVSRNRTRIFQVSADKCAVLSVTGPDLEDPQLSKFFDSIGATQ